MLMPDERPTGYAQLYSQARDRSHAAPVRAPGQHSSASTSSSPGRTSRPGLQYSDQSPQQEQQQQQQPPVASSPARSPAAAAAGSRRASPAASPGRASASSKPAPSAPPQQQQQHPSVSRPATTVLMQASAARRAKLQRLAQRPAARPNRPGGRPAVTLSQVIQQTPLVYDRQRLSAVERFITVVDMLPARYTDAQVVYLSKNSLTSTVGLEQFRAARVLSLADNLLVDMQEVERLAEVCPSMESLTLEGNPLSYLATYRARVILALPGLRSLDARPITDEERAQAPALLQHEDAVMAVMLQNACTVHKMASVVQRAQVHLELLATMHARGAVYRRSEALAEASTSLAKLVEMWDYEGSLGLEERQRIYLALQREVARMYRQLRTRTAAMWDDAYAQVLLAQQQTTAQLLDLLGQCQLALDGLLAGLAQGGGLVREEGEQGGERERQLRNEREGLLVEFRDAAIQLAGGSPAPARPGAQAAAAASGAAAGLAQPRVQPPLKSSLKQPGAGSLPATAPRQGPRSEPASPTAPSRSVSPVRRGQCGGPQASDGGPRPLMLMGTQPQPRPGSLPTPRPRAASALSVSRSVEGGLGVGGTPASAVAGSAVRGAAVQRRAQSAGPAPPWRGGGRAAPPEPRAGRALRAASSARMRSPSPASPGPITTSPLQSPPLVNPTWRPAGPAADAKSAPASPDYRQAAGLARVLKPQPHAVSAKASLPGASGPGPAPAAPAPAPRASSDGYNTGASSVGGARAPVPAPAMAAAPVATPPAASTQSAPPSPEAFALRHSMPAQPSPRRSLAVEAGDSLVRSAQRRRQQQQQQLLRMSAPAAAGSPMARLSLLRSQLEASAKESARLRRIAAVAVSPLPLVSWPASLGGASALPRDRQEHAGYTSGEAPGARALHSAGGEEHPSGRMDGMDAAGRLLGTPAAATGASHPHFDYDTPGGLQQQAQMLGSPLPVPQPLPAPLEHLRSSGSIAGMRPSNSSGTLQQQQQIQLQQQQLQLQQQQLQLLQQQQQQLQQLQELQRTGQAPLPQPAEAQRTATPAPHGRHAPYPMPYPQTHGALLSGGSGPPSIDPIFSQGPGGRPGQEAASPSEELSFGRPHLGSTSASSMRTAADAVTGPAGLHPISTSFPVMQQPSGQSTPWLASGGTGQPMGGQLPGRGLGQMLTAGGMSPMIDLPLDEMGAMRASLDVNAPGSMRLSVAADTPSRRSQAPSSMASDEDFAEGAGSSRRPVREGVGAAAPTEARMRALLNAAEGLSQTAASMSQPQTVAQRMAAEGQMPLRTAALPDSSMGDLLFTMGGPGAGDQDLDLDPDLVDARGSTYSFEFADPTLMRFVPQEQHQQGSESAVRQQGVMPTPVLMQQQQQYTQQPHTRQHQQQTQQHPHQPPGGPGAATNTPGWQLQPQRASAPTPALRTPHGGGADGAPSTGAVYVTPGPAGSTRVTLSDSAGQTRVDVEEEVTEDSAGVKDQHIHVHIHPHPMTLPSISGAPTGFAALGPPGATPSLAFGHPLGRDGDGAPTPVPFTLGPHTAAPAAGMHSRPPSQGGAGVGAAGHAPEQPTFGTAQQAAPPTTVASQPASPLQQVIEGKLIYEKIERYVPVGVKSQRTSPEADRSRAAPSGRGVSRPGSARHSGASGTPGRGGDQRTGSARRQARGVQQQFDDILDVGAPDSGAEEDFACRGGSGSGRPEAWDGAYDMRNMHDSGTTAAVAQDPVVLKYQQMQGQLLEQMQLTSRLAQQLTELKSRAQAPPAWPMPALPPIITRAPPSPSASPHGRTLTSPMARGHSSQPGSMPQGCTTAHPSSLPGVAGDYEQLAAEASLRPHAPAEHHATDAAMHSVSDGGGSRARSLASLERTQLPRPYPGQQPQPMYQLAPVPAVPAPKQHAATSPASGPVSALQVEPELVQGGPTSAASFGGPAAPQASGMAASSPRLYVAAASQPPAATSPTSLAHAAASAAASADARLGPPQHGSGAPWPASSARLPLPPHVQAVADQLDAHTQQNLALQRELDLFGQQLAEERAAASAIVSGPGGEGAAREVSGASHAASTAWPFTQQPMSSAPLAPHTLRAMEQRLVGLTLEKEALEKALVTEQGEVRLLQQELAVMGAVTDALEDTRAQLEEARLAIADQQEQLQACGEELEASRAEAERLKQELHREIEHAKHELQSQADAHSAQVSEMQQAHAEELAALRSDHATQLHAERTEHAALLHAERTEHAAQAASERAAHAQHLDGLRTEHAQQLDALHKEHAQQLGTLHTGHTQQVGDMRAAHQLEVEGLQRQAERALDEQRSAHEGVLSEVRAAHEGVVSELEQAHAAEVSEMRSQHQALLDQVEGELAESSRQLQKAQDELQESLLQLGSERHAHAQLQGRHQQLQAAEAQVRGQHEQLLRELQDQERNEEAASEFARRSLLWRALQQLFHCCQLSRYRHLQHRAAQQLCQSRACRAALRRWRATIVRTRLSRSLAERMSARTMRLAFVVLHHYSLQRQLKAEAMAKACAHHDVRMAREVQRAWLALAMRHARTAAYFEPRQMQAAGAHSARTLMRGALAAWRHFINVHRLPKTQKRRRAISARDRRLLRCGMLGLMQHVDKRAAKAVKEHKGSRRHGVRLLVKAMDSWTSFVLLQRRKRSSVAAAEVLRAHHVVQRWRRAAARLRHHKRATLALQLSADVRRRRAALSGWRSYVLLRRQAALALSLASEQYRATLLRRTMWAWLQLAQQAAARHLHIKGMQEYQAMMQAAMRWQRLVELSRRQQAVVDRAVRMYQHRVVTTTQRAVLQHWRALVEARRRAMHTTALSFVHAFAAVRLRLVLAAWHRVAQRAGIERRGDAEAALQQRAQGLAEGLESAQKRLEESTAEGDRLLQELQQAMSDLEHQHDVLQDRQGTLQRAEAALQEAQQTIQARSSELSARDAEVSGLQQDVGGLQQRVQLLNQQVRARDASIASLQAQASDLQRSLVQAQAHAKDLGLQLRQQAAQYEAQLLGSQEAAASGQRDLDQRAKALARLHQQLADCEEQMRSVKAAHEALVASLRQEVRQKEEQINALQQQLEVLKQGPGIAATAAGAVPVGPAPAPGPLRPSSPAPFRPTSPMPLRPHSASFGALGGAASMDNSPARLRPVAAGGPAGPSRAPLWAPSLLHSRPSTADSSAPYDAGGGAGAGAPPGDALVRTSLRMHPVARTRAPLGAGAGPPAAPNHSSSSAGSFYAQQQQQRAQPQQLPLGAGAVVQAFAVSVHPAAASAASSPDAAGPAFASAVQPVARLESVAEARRLEREAWFERQRQQILVGSQPHPAGAQAPVGRRSSGGGGLAPAADAGPRTQEVERLLLVSKEAADALQAATQELQLHSAAVSAMAGKPAREALAALESQHGQLLRAVQPPGGGADAAAARGGGSGLLPAITHGLLSSLSSLEEGLVSQLPSPASRDYEQGRQGVQQQQQEARTGGHTTTTLHMQPVSIQQQQQRRAGGPLPAIEQPPQPPVAQHAWQVLAAAAAPAVALQEELSFSPPLPTPHLHAGRGVAMQAGGAHAPPQWPWAAPVEGVAPLHGEAEADGAVHALPIVAHADAGTPDAEALFRSEQLHELYRGFGARLASAPAAVREGGTSLGGADGSSGRSLLSLPPSSVNSEEFGPGFPA